MTIRDFRSQPRAVRKTLAAEGEALLTVNGEPVAILVSVEGGLAEAVDLIARVRAQRALRTLRRAAAGSGADRLGTKEIAAVVEATRRDRRGRRPA